MAPHQQPERLFRNLSSSRSSTPSVASTFTSPTSADQQHQQQQHAISSKPAASAPSSAAVIVNPYHSSQKKKQQDQPQTQPPQPAFIGGAATARNKAKRKASGRGKRIMRPGEAEREKKRDVLPTRMNTLERFFAALLRSPASDFCRQQQQQQQQQQEHQLWETICNRVGLEVPTAPVQAVYEDIRAHFDVRACLILEEARHAIAEGLKLELRSNGSNNNSSNRNGNITMHLTANLVERANSHGHVKITFCNQQRSYTPQELFHIRPGGIVAIRQSNTQNGSNNKNIMLGVILSGNRDQMETKRCFTCLIFRPDDVIVQQEDVVRVTAITQLVTELRCFESMVSRTTREAAFLHSLLGRPSAVHTRFVDLDAVADDPNHGGGGGSGGNSTPVVVSSTSGSSPNDSSSSIRSSDNSTITDLQRRQQQQQQESIRDASTYFRLPELNETQEQAATQYLNSKPNTLTLVQGPPGTGKSTLLVSIVCRYLTESMRDGENGKRLLVSAPTNKAVSVLASRFLSAVRQNTHPCPCNAIVVGDVDKLLGDTAGNRHHSNMSNYNNPLHSIFLYTWLPCIIDGYTRIRAHFLPGNARGQSDTLSVLAQLSVQLQHRLTNSLPYLSKNILRWTQKIAQSLAALQQTGAPAPTVVDTVTKLLQELKEMPNEAVWEQLMLSANVIFCTLASAGGTVLRKTSRIDDLIVDEAAAATEPELCIPFHLKPTRLLAVGDPLQLPATVLSRRAIDLGLTKSLHERLMYDCNYPHIMLDLQYRMSVQISSFPSRQFYQSKIGNGPNVTGPSYSSGARLLDRLAYTFLQVTDGREQQSRGGSYSNRAEALQIAELVSNLRQTGGGAWYSAHRIRVITFYQAQVALIQRCLQERGLGGRNNHMVQVATVDSSQGCEADIVLISFVRTGREAGFLTDDRRLNVALTRAKYQLICVGHWPSLAQSRHPTLQRLAADAEERGLLRSPLMMAGAGNRNLTARLDMFYGQPEDTNDSGGPAPKKIRRG